MRRAFAIIIPVLASIPLTAPASAQEGGNFRGMLELHVTQAMASGGVARADLSGLSLADLALIQDILGSSDNRHTNQFRVEGILAR